MFYKMMSAFLTDMCKYIQKKGAPCVRAHGLDGDVFVGSYGKLKMAMCYRGEFFFVVPENFQMFDASLYQQGPDFSSLSYDGRFAVHFNGIISHPRDRKKLLREVISADPAGCVFRRRDKEGKEVFGEIAYIQEKYAKWLEVLDEYYGHMTELVTDGKGAIVLKRINGDVLAVALEVRI